MAKITIFDVLVVYSSRLATSANSPSFDVSTPFTKGSSNENYNIAYGYFLKVCQKNKLKAALTTSSDIIGPGECFSYWLFENNCWIKVKKTGYSKLIFDKFSPTNKKIKASRDLLFSSHQVKPFNHPYLFNLFFDKLLAYKKLSKFSLPTVAIEDNTKRNISQACKKLKQAIARHPHQNDFSNDYIMKDRFGSGGRNVYKFKADQPESMAKSIKKNNKISYILQPFAKFDKGFSYQNSRVSTDIRLIYLGGKIIQTYIRMAKAGDFRCNEHQGGTLKYIPKSQVPTNVLLTSNKIAKVLNKKSSLYTLDFIITNNGNIYLLEGNTKPGLDWNLSIKENEIEAKKLIRIIVKKLVKLAILPINTASLYAVKVLDRNGSGFLSDVIEGLEWSVGSGMQIVNMSLGTNSDIQSFHDAVIKVNQAGIVQVAAAGNDGGAVDFPGAYAEVIAVAAVQQNADGTLSAASFTSRGTEVDLSAPGVSVLSTYKGSSYVTLSGTSMATPHVTGVAALVLTTLPGAYDLNANASWDPTEVQNKLMATSENIGLDPTLFGSGFVRADLAIQ